VRFTPPENCRVIKAKVYSYINAGAPSNCTVFVADNQIYLPNAIPGTIRYTGTYMPVQDGWQEIEITSPVAYDADTYFWIMIKLPTGGNDIWAVADSYPDYPKKNATAPANGSWMCPSPILAGDLCIRAIVSYAGVEEELFPSDIVDDLKQNYPNPVLDKTTISYAISQNMKVELRIYDIAGKLVRTLVDGVQSAGPKTVAWDKKNANGEVVQSGVYFYKLNTDTIHLTKPMIVL
jgi:hypothetical protein